MIHVHGYQEVLDRGPAARDRAAASARGMAAPKGGIFFPVGRQKIPPKLLKNIEKRSPSLLRLNVQSSKALGRG